MSDERFLNYEAEPNSNSYRGFRLKGTVKENNTRTKLILSNGSKDFLGVGNSYYAALSNTFNQIDNYLQSV